MMVTGEMEEGAFGGVLGGKERGLSTRTRIRCFFTRSFVLLALAFAREHARVHVR